MTWWLWLMSVLHTRVTRLHALLRCSRLFFVFSIIPSDIYFWVGGTIELSPLLSSPRLKGEEHKAPRLLIPANILSEQLYRSLGCSSLHGNQWAEKIFFVAAVSSVRPISLPGIFQPAFEWNQGFPTKLKRTWWPSFTSMQIITRNTQTQFLFVLSQLIPRGIQSVGSKLWSENPNKSEIHPKLFLVQMNQSHHQEHNRYDAIRN